MLPEPLLEELDELVPGVPGDAGPLEDEQPVKQLTAATAIAPPRREWRRVIGYPFT